MVTTASQRESVKANVVCDGTGKPKWFTLTLGTETIDLEPGKPWSKVDHFKWITRGLIEEPQSFHVQPDGTVEVNGEKIGPHEKDGPTKLALEVNKHHEPTVTHAPPATPPASVAPVAALPDHVIFRVHLDHLGHLSVECRSGEERTSTGVRGLPGLVQAGLMNRPRALHIDPLQSYVELDDVRFDCTIDGARQLEEALNGRYAPALGRGEHLAVEVKENPASPTGFDIRFLSAHGGVRAEVKGHLAQEHLDLLADPERCGLLQPGILIRLSPPKLLVRRRRPDGGEEPIPELPDVMYRRMTGAELQERLNHPLVRRGAGPSQIPTSRTPSGPPVIIALHITRNPANRMSLWLDCKLAGNRPGEGKALTHHNIAELQHAGVFLPTHEVALSLDGQQLSIRDRNSGQEETVALPLQTSDLDLDRASRLLTAALNPPPPAPASPTPDPVQTALPPPSSPPPVAPASVSPPPRDPDPDPALHSPLSPLPEPALPPPQTESAPKAALRSLFDQVPSPQLCQVLFHRVADHFKLPVQDILLTLPRAFENRRFEIITFNAETLENILDLRSGAFYGLYLSHVNPQRIPLVYGCNGKHIEWTPERCSLQTAPGAEPSEFKGNALLGVAQHTSGPLAFVVTRPFLDWAKPHEKALSDAPLRFLTVDELLEDPDAFTLIWPALASTPAAGTE